jgi:hypothetical protein
VNDDIILDRPTAWHIGILLLAAFAAAFAIGYNAEPESEAMPTISICINPELLLDQDFPEPDYIEVNL